MLFRRRALSYDVITIWRNLRNFVKAILWSSTVKRGNPIKSFDPEKETFTVKKANKGNLIFYGKHEDNIYRSKNIFFYVNEISTRRMDQLHLHFAT